MALERLFHLMAEKSASDLYLAVGSPITIKINGVCVPINQERLAPQAIVSLLAERLTDSHFRELEDTRELNIGLPVTGVGSFRLSAFLQRGSISAVVRYIPHEVPRLDELMLPDVLKDLIMERRGLILVVGAAGSGKSTSIASMLDHRNELITGHILTFEDPIEFLFRNKKSIINQREIGTDAKSLHAALRNAMRQAPDVLFIGEIRDRDTMGAALAYSLSGHLVVATMHATNSAHALNRVISFYTPETRQALFEDLAASLKAVVSQRLVRSKKGGRVPAVEVLMNAGQMTSLIERGDVSGIKEAMEQSLAPESQSFEQSLYTLLQKDVVTREDALAAADSKNNLLWFINNAGKPNAAVQQPKKAANDTSSFSEFTLNI
ncbi:PilT/PilU family type 4a pilus ATPase [Betaproteobacteria bacterium PRO7]|jgi:twitching motility protein PilU|nr:PilT/PilU family type 4a pilus ATPase [Betaproteobacteria bacterium PRO7]GIL04599.1 MAG: twitching motility protein PilT [Betaproteobacteria bacterium]